MLEPSLNVMKSIITQIKEHHFDGHLIVVSNPVDLMSYYAYKLSGLPANQVIGTGTTLDTARLKYFIAQKSKLILAVFMRWSLVNMEIVK